MSAPPRESELLVEHTFARVFRAMERLRVGGAAIVGTLGILFLVYDEPLWKPLTALVVTVGLIVLSVRDLRRTRATYRPGEVVTLIGSALCAQLTVIVLTGGIRSPLLLIAMPLVLGLAIGAPSVKLLKPVFSFLVVFVAGLGLGDVLGWWPPEALVPEVLSRHDDAAAVGYASLATLVFLVVIVVASFVGVFVRRRVQGAIEAAIAARAETLEAMRARHRELEALSGALAHELKNPLASIRGLAVLLARKLPDASQEAERMGVLLGEVQRMGHILDEFLNFSRPAEGLATSTVSASGLVAEVNALHEGEAAQRDVRIRTDVRTDATLIADPRKLKQVLVNLVQNALEASPAGATVVVGASAVGDDVVFEVVDEGPGLDAAIAGRLFTVGATTKAAGTGLGLVIARGIAEQHGGRLTLEARAGHPDGRGCVARLTMPGNAVRGGAS